MRMFMCLGLCMTCRTLILHNKFCVGTNLIDRSRFDHRPVYGSLPFSTTIFGEGYSVIGYPTCIIGMITNI